MLHLDEGEGLVEALEDLAEQTRATGAIECVFRPPPTRQTVEPKTAMYLYRIAQEAVRNALQHSGAHRLQISLTHKRDAVVLSVRDNGTGFVADQPGTCEDATQIGFSIMQHRSRAIGAKLEINHPTRGGIEVICTVPRYKTPRGRK